MTRFIGRGLMSPSMMTTKQKKIVKQISGQLKNTGILQEFNKAGKSGKANARTSVKKGGQRRKRKIKRRR